MTRLAIGELKSRSVDVDTLERDQYVRPPPTMRTKHYLSLEGSPMRLSPRSRPPVHSTRFAGWRSWILSVLGLIWAGPLALAQAPTGTITGRVTDVANGVPMVGVSVRVSTTQIG